MYLSQNMKNQLAAVDFSTQDIQRIETYALLLNDLLAFEQGGGQFIKVAQGASARGWVISIGPGYNKLSLLAHELRHVVGTHQAQGVDAYSSALEYSKARVRGEGEALYFQYLADLNFGVNTLHHGRGRKAGHGHGCFHPAGPGANHSAEELPICPRERHRANLAMTDE